MSLSEKDVDFLGEWLKAGEEATEELDRKLATILNDISSILVLLRWVVYGPLLIIPTGILFYFFAKI